MALAKALGIESLGLPELTGISTEPFGKNRKAFSLSELKTLIRLNRISQGALEIFKGDVRSQRKWLKTSATELDGKTPLQMGMNKEEAKAVEEYLLKIDRERFLMAPLVFKPLKEN